MDIDNTLQLEKIVVTKPEGREEVEKRPTLARKPSGQEMKNLPECDCERAAALMVATPLMFLLFIFNLIKSLIGTAIGWVAAYCCGFFLVICY